MVCRTKSKTGQDPVVCGIMLGIVLSLSEGGERCKTVDGVSHKMLSQAEKRRMQPFFSRLSEKTLDIKSV